MKDKILHFFVGLVVVSGLTYAGVDIIWSVLILLILAIGKELYDKYIKKTKFDIWDIVATLLGGIVLPLLIIIVFRHIINNL